MSDIKLKPCPFCGAVDDVDRDDSCHLYINFNREWHVHCHGCGIGTRQLPTKAEAITAWNTRPTEAAADARGMEAAAARVEELLGSTNHISDAIRAALNGGQHE